MILRKQTITIFGATGFLGRYIVRNIASKGCKINIFSRDAEKAAFLRTNTSIGQMNIIEGDINNKKLIEKIVKQSDIVINLVGILYEKRHGDFARIHAQFPETLAILAKKYNLKQLIHLSALGVNINTNSSYASSKLSGENAIKENFSNYVILRPSVVFGHEDNFVNQFARMALYSPFLPLIHKGSTKFQPVYVKDIADAIIEILLNVKFNNNIYEIGGPDIYSFKEILTLITKIIKRKRILLNLPGPVSYLMAGILEKLPKPLLTIDQVKLLTTDSVTQNKMPTFYELGIQPQSFEDKLPEILHQYEDHSYFKG